MSDPTRRARFFLGLILALPVLIALAISAFAHEFYPYECCSDQDCWPMGVGAEAREPAPTATPSGWRLHDGVIVPYAATRPSPDGRFHVCRRAGSLTGAVITPWQQPPCLWAPQPAS